MISWLRAFTLELTNQTCQIIPLQFMLSQPPAEATALEKCALAVSFVAYREQKLMGISL